MGQEVTAGRPGQGQPRPPLDEGAALRALVEGTATETGEAFFAALVRNLALVLGTQGAWVTEYQPDSRRLPAFAFRLDVQRVSNYTYDVDGTPCTPVVEQRRLVHIPDNVVAFFPSDPGLRQASAICSLGNPRLCWATPRV